MLNEHERLDTIAGTTFSIIQSDDVFVYSIDAVLLGRFAYIPIQRGNILDLCSGNGIVGMVLAERTKAAITLVELQEQLHDMAIRTVKANRVMKQVTPICLDLKQIKTMFSHGLFDTVTCNPPYFTIEANHQMKEARTKALARHELACTLADTVEAGSYVLKHGGKLAMVHRPERVADIFDQMRTYHIEPKRLRFCHSRYDQPATMVLVEGTKGGKPGMVCEAPLVVYQTDGCYTRQFEQEYFKK